MTIQKVAVIGSGVMGSGIAAQIANAGLPVLFYDLQAPNQVIERMKAQGPSGPFMDPSRAALLEPLSIEADLGRLAEADWICEVIVEDLKLKHDLYTKLETVRKKDAVVSSNTSTIPLEQLVDGRSDGFKQHFLITHFFNPPRQMRLLELVVGADTLPDVAARMTAFCEQTLGKGVVPCFDRPGFIANRIGVYWLMLALHKGIEQGVDIAAADAAMAKLYGIPKTGAFGLIDLIGLDLMPKMAKSLASNLPDSDPFQSVAHSPELLTAMIEAGYTGRKGKGGFTRLLKNGDGSKTKLVLDLSRPFDAEASYKLEEKKLPAEVFAREVMDATLDYAASLLGEVADDKGAIDAAMVWGYGWGKGPFALRGETVSLPHPKGAMFVSDCTNILAENEHALLRDAGDNVGLLQFKTKMNVFDDGVFSMLETALDKDIKALVIGTDAAHFSAGANVQRFLDYAQNEQWDALEAFLTRGQSVMKRVRTAPFPIVSAVCGYVMGGACELSLHSTAIVAHAETTIGLVEPRVGVIPGWGGCVEAVQRLGAVTALQTILSQWQSASALEAQSKGYLAKDDVIVMNRDLLLRAAKTHALTLQKPRKEPFRPATQEDVAAMKNWLETAGLKPHDRLIGEQLIGALGGQTEEAVWEGERAGFLSLMRTKESQDRIRKILGS